VARYIVARIDDTGEWGLCVTLPNLFAGQAWRFITEKAGANAIAPAGMAARDVLRLQAGLPRYGYELNETLDPFAAGLGDLVAFNHDFIGAAALAGLKDKAPARRLAGVVLKPAATELQAQGPIIPRQGSAVTRADGSECGVITSAAYSPAMDKVIALAYLSIDCASPASSLRVCFDGKTVPAETSALPFNR
jgi:aminomethyltransferase